MARVPLLGFCIWVKRNDKVNIVLERGWMDTVCLKKGSLCNQTLATKIIYINSIQGQKRFLPSQEHKIRPWCRKLGINDHKKINIALINCKFKGTSLHLLLIYWSWSSKVLQVFPPSSFFLLSFIPPTLPFFSASLFCEMAKKVLALP